VGVPYLDHVLQVPGHLRSDALTCATPTSPAPNRSTSARTNATPSQSAIGQDLPAQTPLSPNHRHAVGAGFVPVLEQQTGRPVHSRYRAPGKPLRTAPFGQVRSARDRIVRQGGSARPYRSRQLSQRPRPLPPRHGRRGHQPVEPAGRPRSSPGSASQGEPPPEAGYQRVPPLSRRRRRPGADPGNRPFRRRRRKHLNAFKHRKGTARTRNNGKNDENFCELRLEHR
jgi:hypothetical protein